MVLPNNGTDFMVRIGGRPLRLRYYSTTVGSVWDDDISYTKSGNDVYLSGVKLELERTQGSDDAILLQEGRLKYGDCRFIFSGSIVNGSGTVFPTITISGADTVFRIIEIGAHKPEYYGVNSYNHVYCREIVNGSLF